MRIKYTLIGVGWSRAVLDVEGQEVAITASYLSDALGNLVTGVALLAEGLADVHFSWDVEPGEYRWRLTREHADKIRLRILAFDDSSAAPDESGRPVIDTIHDRRQFIQAVLDAAVEVRDELGEHEYDHRWHSHPFPSAAVDRLGVALDSLEPRVVEWHEAIRAQPRLWFAEQNLQPLDLLKHVVVDAMYELACSIDSVCFVDIHERSATVTDDGPGLLQESVGQHDPLIARFGTLLTPQPDVRGSLAHVVALCSSFAVETVADGERQSLKLRQGVVVDGPTRGPAHPLDPATFTRITLEPDWTYFGVDEDWPTPVPDVVSQAAAFCSGRGWWHASIPARIATTDHRGKRTG